MILNTTITNMVCVRGAHGVCGACVAVWWVCVCVCVCVCCVCGSCGVVWCDLMWCGVWCVLLNTAFTNAVCVCVCVCVCVSYG